MGELYSGPWEMAPLIEDELVDAVQTDLSNVVGITPAEKFARIAEHHYARTAFHTSPDVSPAASTPANRRIRYRIAIPSTGCFRPVPS